MPTHPQILLAQKVYSLLTSDTTLMALITGVYEQVPDNTAYPYVKIGDYDFSEWDTHTANGVDGDVTIKVWDQDRGENIVMQILNRIYHVLHNQELGLSGFSTVVFRFRTGNIAIEPDGRTYQGIAIYHVILGG
jgi:hypothetical protein